MKAAVENFNKTCVPSYMKIAGTRAEDDSVIDAFADTLKLWE